MKIETFRTLHESGCFVMPNPWDIGSAKALANLGAKALATTSAGMAFSHGLPDLPTALSVDLVIEHIRQVVNATSLPVNADFQAGYGGTPEEIAKNVARCVTTGIAGLSIEDATGDPSSPLYDRETAIARFKAARRAIDESKTGVLLTGRCEAWLVGDPNAERVALDRLVAFAEAGADCLYAPRVTDPEAVSRIVRAVAPKPVNVLVIAPTPGFTVAELADRGVRRISVGSALSRVAWGAFLRSAADILTTGRFDSLSTTASGKEIESRIAD